MIKQLIRKSNMNLTEFSNYFKIPYRTVQNWENGSRTPPKYIIDLMEYKLISEKIIEKEDKKMNKKYTIYKDQQEITIKKHTGDILTKDEIFNAYFNDLNDTYQKEIAKYDTIENAKEELEKINARTRQYSKNLFLIEIAYIEEEEYDDEDEWIDSFGCIEFKCEEIKIL